MSQADFRPIAYVKDRCPWSLKFRLFLLEAGLQDRFDFREFAPGDDREAAIRAELAPHFTQPTFPTVQIAPDVYMRESDDLIAHYAAVYGVDLASLPTLDQYVRGPLVTIAELRAEIAQLRR
ncbi:glutathione S-transferase N-terminal domain-containing protein [Novosphingobium sp. KACC 22771]|uniref:glutathione S-transferase N-terminal domain-containing protein n=1 Tax=Novosphingobium sp. KACC 22771 TaxID=3025670 RepID=UPI002366F2A2|nr:glutathione S-transferase N-terminal domain-containing protein [Novosphingobium sp. KACC 22771]WDF73917.1 glutathione S-transferase N-terminal domain-containing protein [Novosphingobium sp. KACC 22771]